MYATSTGVDANPYACDVNGLATLSNCNDGEDSTPKSLREDGDIVKSVTLAGAFISQPWATNGKESLSMDEVKEFYKSKDFQQMVDLGVNTVQIPVPCNVFYEKGDVAETVSHLLEKADKVGLSAILVLVPMDDDDEIEVTADMIDKHVASAAQFASDTTTVIAIQLPSSKPSLLSAVRSVDTELSVLVPTSKGQLETLSVPPDGNVFAALDVDAVTSIAGIASSDSESDRMKMFYRELYLYFHFVYLFILFYALLILSISHLPAR